MDPGCSALDEQFRQLHNGCETTVTSIRIRNDRRQKVCIGYPVSLCLWRAQTLFTLLPIVEKLGKEKLMDFIWDGVLSLLTIF